MTTNFRSQQYFRDNRVDEKLKQIIEPRPHALYMPSHTPSPFRFQLPTQSRRKDTPKSLQDGFETTITSQAKSRIQTSTSSRNVIPQTPTSIVGDGFAGMEFAGPARGLNKLEQQDGIDTKARGCPTPAATGQIRQSKNNYLSEDGNREREEDDAEMLDQGPFAAEHENTVSVPQDSVEYLSIHHKRRRIDGENTDPLPVEAIPTSHNMADRSPSPTKPLQAAQHSVTSTNTTATEHIQSAQRFQAKSILRPGSRDGTSTFNTPPRFTMPPRPSSSSSSSTTAPARTAPSPFTLFKPSHASSSSTSSLNKTKPSSTTHRPQTPRKPTFIFPGDAPLFTSTPTAASNASTTNEAADNNPSTPGAPAPTGPQTQAQTQTQTHHPTLLPAVFSPHKNRSGGDRFIPGGWASQLRSWVIEASSSSSSSSSSSLISSSSSTSKSTSTSTAPKHKDKAKGGTTIVRIEEARGSFVHGNFVSGPRAGDAVAVVLVGESNPSNTSRGGGNANGGLGGSGGGGGAVVRLGRGMRVCLREPMWDVEMTNGKARDRTEGDERHRGNEDDDGTCKRNETTTTTTTTTTTWLICASWNVV